MAYQIQVRGEWAGSVGGWRPAVSGSVNQTGLSDEHASTFASEIEAEAALVALVREGAHEAELRIVEIGR